MSVTRSRVNSTLPAPTKHTVVTRSPDCRRAGPDRARSGWGGGKLEAVDQAEQLLGDPLHTEPDHPLLEARDTDRGRLGEVAEDQRDVGGDAQDPELALLVVDGIAALPGRAELASQPTGRRHRRGRALGQRAVLADPAPYGRVV